MKLQLTFIVGTNSNDALSLGARWRFWNAHQAIYLVELHCVSYNETQSVAIGDRLIQYAISVATRQQSLTSCAILIMYVGLFGHSAVVSSCFYVLLTVCVVVFFSDILLIY